MTYIANLEALLVLATNNYDAALARHIVRNDSLTHAALDIALGNRAEILKDLREARADTDPSIAREIFAENWGH